MSRIRGGMSIALAILIILAIVVIAAVGIYVATLNFNSSSETGKLLCNVKYYTVWSVEYFSNSSTLGGTSTQLSNTSFTTNTSVSHSVGYTITTEHNFTGTLTGALAEWTTSDCTYLK